MPAYNDNQRPRIPGGKLESEEGDRDNLGNSMDGDILRSAGVKGGFRTLFLLSFILNLAILSS
jgi:hypothetical protein